MPYDNLPESDWPKMDRCVEDVMGKDSSLDKQAAIAICYTSIAGKEKKMKESNPFQELIDFVSSRFSAKESISVLESKIYSAFNAQFPSQSMAVPTSLSYWIAEIFTDYVIVNANSKFYRVPYTKIGDDIKFSDDLQQWQEVQEKKQWIDKAARLKAGARHSSTDQKALQAIHDSSVDLGASCPMTVFKQADGKYRWVLISSTAFEDRDGEIVSTKAQENDIASLDKSGDYGVLRWWHVGRPYATKAGDWRTWVAGKGIDLGVCDFSAMHGRVRIESGTFNNNEVGARLKEVANDLSVSIGFSHPETEPDRGGVFENIHTFERSLLPRGKQSNYFVSIPIIEKESNMDNKKIAALKELLGMNADEIINKAELTDKAAEAAGVAFKEGEGKPFAFGSEADAKAFVKKCMDEMMGEKEKPDAAKAEKEAQTDKVLAELQTTLKQLMGNDEQIAAALNQLGAISKKNAEAIADLNGSLPRSLKELKRSEAEDNVVPKEKVEATLKGLANPAGQDDFFTWSATGSNKAATPVA